MASLYGKSVVGVLNRPPAILVRVVLVVIAPLGSKRTVSSAEAVDESLAAKLGHPR